MSEIRRVPKNGWNNHHQYHFATDGDVSDLIRPLMAKHAVTITPTMLGIESWEPHGKMNRMVVSWSMLVACPTEERRVSWFSESLDNQDKGLSKAATAALKYFTLKLFQISSGDDVDPDAQAGDAARAKSKAKTKTGNETTTGNQLAELKTLVKESGGTWDQFVVYVKKQSGVGPGELPKAAADAWIARLKKRAEDQQADNQNSKGETNGNT